MSYKTLKRVILSTFESSAPPKAGQTAPRTDALAQRLAQIMACLYQGHTLGSTGELARQFGVSPRTIERDLHQRLHGIIERSADGNSWQLTAQARATIPVRYLDNYAVLTGTQGLFPDTSRQWLFQQLDAAPECTGLHIQTIPNESLDNTSVNAFTQLQTAIQQRHPCRFSYKGKTRLVHPLRLIRKSSIWYLAAVEIPGPEHPKNYSWRASMS